MNDIFSKEKDIPIQNSKSRLFDWYIYIYSDFINHACVKNIDIINIFFIIWYLHLQWDILSHGLSIHEVAYIHNGKDPVIRVSIMQANVSFR